MMVAAVAALTVPASPSSAEGAVKAFSDKTLAYSFTYPTATGERRDPPPPPAATRGATPREPSSDGPPPSPLGPPAQLRARPCPSS